MLTPRYITLRYYFTPILRYAITYLRLLRDARCLLFAVGRAMFVMRFCRYHAEATISRRCLITLCSSYDTTDLFDYFSVCFAARLSVMARYVLLCHDLPLAMMLVCELRLPDVYADDMALFATSRPRELPDCHSFRRILGCSYYFLPRLLVLLPRAMRCWRFAE